MVDNIISLTLDYVSTAVNTTVIYDMTMKCRCRIVFNDYTEAKTPEKIAEAESI